MGQTQQYEFECICGYIWIDNERQSCPMCDGDTNITAEPYESLPPNELNREHYVKGK